MKNIPTFIARLLLITNLTFLSFTYFSAKINFVHFELLVRLGEAIARGADIAPVLATARNLKIGDFDSWTEVFWKLANQTTAQAEDPEIPYDAINARDTWFSTAT